MQYCSESTVSTQGGDMRYYTIQDARLEKLLVSATFVRYVPWSG